MSDLIRRADAIEMAVDVEAPQGTYERAIYVDDLMALPSVDAEKPLVIRAKTFMRKEDFDKWAEDIKKQNKSIVCIPCDAEVVSAEAVQGEWRQISPARIYECSICNHNVLTDYIDTYNYCPNCGAIMKGGEEE